MQTDLKRWRYKRQISTANNAKIIRWLDDSSSMTKRLEKLTDTSVKVKVNSQTMKMPTRDEAQILKLKSRRYALIREVMISTSEMNLIVGRSIFPKKFLQGRTKKLIFSLKRKALGALLFKEPSMERDAFQFSLKQANTHNPAVWARRGKISIKNKSFLLTETVMPELISYFHNL